MSDYDDYLDEPNRQQRDEELAEYAEWADTTHRNLLCRAAVLLQQIQQLERQGAVELSGELRGQIADFMTVVPNDLEGTPALECSHPQCFCKHICIATYLRTPDRPPAQSGVAGDCRNPSQCRGCGDRCRLPTGWPYDGTPYYYRMYDAAAGDAPDPSANVLSPDELPAGQAPA